MNCNFTLCKISCAGIQKCLKAIKIYFHIIHSRHNERVKWVRTYTKEMTRFYQLLFLFKSIMLLSDSRYISENILKLVSGLYFLDSLPFIQREITQCNMYLNIIVKNVFLISSKQYFDGIDGIILKSTTLLV